MSESERDEARLHNFALSIAPYVRGRRVSGALVLLLCALLSSTSGCVSAFVTLCDPVPFAGVQADTHIIFNEPEFPEVLLAVGDVVLNLPMDTVLLFFTLPASAVQRRVLLDPSQVTFL